MPILRMVAFGIEPSVDSPGRNGVARVDESAGLLYNFRGKVRWILQFGLPASLSPSRNSGRIASLHRLLSLIRHSVQHPQMNLRMHPGMSTRMSGRMGVPVGVLFCPGFADGTVVRVDVRMAPGTALTRHCQGRSDARQE